MNQNAMNRTTLMSLTRQAARPVRVRGSVIEVPLAGVFVGELCDIKHSIWDDAIFGQAQVIGLNPAGAVLSLVNDPGGLSDRCVVVPTGKRFSVDVSDALLGSVVDATGTVRASLRRAGKQGGEGSEGSEGCQANSKANHGAADADSGSGSGSNFDPNLDLDMNSHYWTPCPIERAPPTYDERRSVSEVFETGIRTIDALLTCGRGQRIGVFAPAGAGKTSLMSMLVSHAEADVFVVGLVGERGREVTEFLESGIPDAKRDRTIVVYSTSDRFPVERRNAALIATTIAEYFRDSGRNVLLMIDSMTRYARALRDVSLAAGELPARRGYPPSVMENLPRILERSGITHRGCITAFYTVLLEDEEEADPIGEEVRSILDGHIYLTRKLAGRGHFPAIDVLKSVSRVATDVAPPDLTAAAQKVRAMLSRLDELQLMVDLGEYREGENPEVDDLMSRKADLESFLKQGLRERSSLRETMEWIDAL
jgi:FliI/YscN family ATPase